MHMGTKYYIGVMSGTSLDGIDCSLVEFGLNSFRLHRARTFLINDSLCYDLKNLIIDQGNDLEKLEVAGKLLGIEYACAINALITEANISKNQIKAIGISGQTIAHHPDQNPPFSLQIGSPSEVLSLTGITVVHDFRKSDIDAGGQGAPLLPLFHQFLFQEKKAPLFLLNIGGISNLTYINNDSVIGFDCGPGNTLIDWYANLFFSLSHDIDGKLAAQGKVNAEFLSRLYADPYFHLIYPKSTGREYFNHLWVKKHLDKMIINPVDIISTLTELTANCIVSSIKKIKNYGCCPIFLYGGGVHNKELCSRIIKKLPEMVIKSTSTLGIDPDFMESMGFAWLAQQRIKKRQFNLSAITGSKGMLSLGEILRINA
jgi:anhydro-N-acetylmuramic acid kinase